ncbi:unnamed protein product [Symbiodinium sp. CCMP2592]|nr:unnamed protein product [Symbiodinium sp. CCMP2592]
MNNVTITIEDEHPSSFAVALVHTQPKTAALIADETPACEEEDALRRVRMLLKDTWGITMEEFDLGPKPEPPPEEEPEAPPQPDAPKLDEEDEEVTCVLSNKLRLRCPLSFERVDIPVRGETCIMALRSFSLHFGCAGIGLWLVAAGGVEEECFSSECSNGQVHDSNFLQMQLSLDSPLENEVPVLRLRAVQSVDGVEVVTPEETGIIDTIKSKLNPLANIIEKIKAKASEKVSSNAQTGDGNSTSEEHLVVDRRNFSQLRHDLNQSQQELADAQVLATDFEKALFRVEAAKHQVLSAKDSKEADLEWIHKLLGVTIKSEMLLDKNLPLEEAMRLSDPLAEHAKVGAKTALEVAKLTEAVRKLDQEIIQHKAEYEKALKDQTGNVTKIQELLRSSILREMADARLVQVLDASDRIGGTVTFTTTTVTTTVATEGPSKIIVVVPSGNITRSENETSKTSMTTTSTTSIQATSTKVSVSTSTEIHPAMNVSSNSSAAEDKVGLYPSDWAVIGSLILLGVLVALITIYSRTVGA